MDLQEVYNIIHKVADGFEENALQCLDNQSDKIVEAIREQIYGGQNGNGESLSPTYDNDPFFEEKGIWHRRSQQYKAWKKNLPPRNGSSLLGLPPRQDNVPNLYIDGTFYSEISATRRGDILYVSPGNGNGPAIVAKYGESLLDIGDSAVAYFNREFLLPAIEKFFNDCGYR